MSLKTCTRLHLSFLRTCNLNTAMRNPIKVTSLPFQAINHYTQGHATDPKNLHPQDTQSQSVRGGFKARRDGANQGLDAASEKSKAEKGKTPEKTGKGNPEKIGFVEQVGGASGTARKFEEEEK